MTPAADPPVLDARTYQDLVDEALARIPIHNPEWTNFNRTDPGVTLLELFAFMTESLLYRANLIPERNRRRFLDLLGVQLAGACAAQGLVTFANDRSGAPASLTLPPGVELRAGQVPFVTAAGLDVLPVDSVVMAKRELRDPAPEVEAYYRQLYASYEGQKPALSELKLYTSSPVGPEGIDVAGDAVDRSVWIALLLRRSDHPDDATKDAVRAALAGRTLNIGVVPQIDDPSATLSPGSRTSATDAPLSHLDVQLPRLPDSGLLPDDPSQRVAQYRSLDVRASHDPAREPAVLQVTLPDADGLRTWTDLSPLEAGVGEFPPAIDDDRLAARVVTWVRIQAPAGSRAMVSWIGINAAEVSQRSRVAGEVLAAGTGEPDQLVALARKPVLPGTVRLTVVPRPGAAAELWQEVEDLYLAGPEVAVADPRSPAGTTPPPAAESRAFVLDAQAGTLRFGDGLHGRRPPLGSELRADYDVGAGAAGNVAAGLIATGAGLPPGLKVTNPVRTWGGADAEDVADGERRAARFLQHRDRLVTADDFEEIARATPKVAVGRVDVIPAFSPELGSTAAGDAPGAVTLMLLPASDPAHPTAPQPDQPFLDAVCDHLDPRRLVTTEVFLRGPSYQGIWVSIGIDVVPGHSIPDVRDATAAALRAFLDPYAWPRDRAVQQLELQAVASRVDGVRLVRGALLALGDGGSTDSVPMAGLQLPQLLGLMVSAGDPMALDDLRGLQPAPTQVVSTVPVPVIPETC